LRLAHPGKIKFQPFAATKKQNQKIKFLIEEKQHRRGEERRGETK
jgi:hypothetical protein